MIYSPDIQKICGLCRMSREAGGDEVYCIKKRRTVPKSNAACAKFSYDILKRKVKRGKRLRTDFDPEDFAL